MNGPSIHGGTPPPFPNEFITIVMLFFTLCGFGYFFWRISKDGIGAFRNSTLFWVALSLAMSAYYTAYVGMKSSWR